MVKGDIMDYFGLSGYTNDQLRNMGYVVWMPVQEKGSWLGEGDDFTFMNMLGNGLRAYEVASYGGWGGRDPIDKGVNNFSFQITDTSQQAMVSALSAVNKNSDAFAYPDFFPAAQRDFAARLKWSVTPKYANANHAPVATIEGPANFLASAGETIKLNTKVFDPDGDNVSIKWWQFFVGTYPNKVDISNPSSSQIKLVIPKDAVPGQTVHIILEATDNGIPAVTTYQRVIIVVRNK
jgi:hypothetical protein